MATLVECLRQVGDIEGARLRRRSEGKRWWVVWGAQLMRDDGGITTQLSLDVAAILADDWETEIPGLPVAENTPRKVG